MVSSPVREVCHGNSPESRVSRKGDESRHAQKQRSHGVALRNQFNPIHRLVGTSNHPADGLIQRASPPAIRRFTSVRLGRLPNHPPRLASSPEKWVRLTSVKSRKTAGSRRNISILLMLCHAHIITRIGFVRRIHAVAASGGRGIDAQTGRVPPRSPTSSCPVQDLLSGSPRSRSRDMFRTLR